MGRSALTGAATRYVAGEFQAARKRRGWTIDDLYRRAGVPRATVARALTGDSALSVEVLLPLAFALGLDARELIGQAARVYRAAQQSDPDLPDLSPSQYTLAARRMSSRGKAIRAELDAAGEESQDEEE